MKNKFILLSTVGMLAIGLTLGASNVNAQTYFAANSNNVISGSADIGGCGAACPGGRNVQNLGGPGHGAITFNGIAAAKAGSVKVTITYDNGSSSALPLAVSVNGGTSATVSLPRTGSWFISKTVAINVVLKAGTNHIKLSGVGNAWAAEICSLTFSISTPIPPVVTPPPPVVTPPPPVVTPPPSGNTVSLTTFGSVGKGGNDTSVFVAALNATAKAGEQLTVPAGNYNTSTLNIPSSTNLYLEPGVTITAVPGFSSSQHLVEISGNNIRITGTKGKSIFQMNKSTFTDRSEYRHCLAIENASNVTIDGISCNSSGGDGVYLNHATNTVLKNSIFDKNSRDAMSIINVNGLLVDHCDFSNTQPNPNGGTAPDGPWAGIDMEPNVATDQLQNVTIQYSSLTGNGGNGVMVTTGNLSAAAGTIGVTLDNLTSTGNNTRNVAGTGGFVFWNGINHDPNNQFGTVTLKNSTSTNDGGYGVEARFWDFSNPGTKLVITNITIIDPQKGLKQDAAIGVNGGGGEVAPAGNISMSNLIVHYTNGYSLPYYFDCSPFNNGGMAAISITGISGSGQSKSSLGLLDGSPVNSVNLN